MSASNTAPTALSAASPAALPASSPKQIIIPGLGSSPAPPFFSQSDQYQAAKYFTFIFFGLSVFVILLFGGFVVCHCYRRLRYERNRQPSIEGEQASQGHAPRGHGNIEIPVKQGFVVQNPDGGLNVAYIPDTPRAPSGAKPAPESPSSVGGLPGSAASSPADGQVGSPGSSLEPSSSSNSSGRDGSREAPSHTGPEGSSAQRGNSRRGWPRVFGSAAPAPESTHNVDIENQLPQPQSADTARRQRQAGLFHMF